MEALILARSNSNDVIARFMTNVLMDENCADIQIAIKHSENALDELSTDIADYISGKYGIEFKELKNDIEKVIKKRLL